MHQNSSEKADVSHITTHIRRIFLEFEVSLQLTEIKPTNTLMWELYIFTHNLSFTPT